MYLNLPGVCCSMGTKDSADSASTPGGGGFLHIEEFVRTVSELLTLPAEPLHRRELYSELLACGLHSRRDIREQLLRDEWKPRAAALLDRFNAHAESHGQEIRLGDDEQLTALLTSRFSQQILQRVDKKSQKLRPRRIVRVAQLMEKLR